MDLGKAAYELLFRQSPLPMWLYDLDDYRFIDINRAALSELGYSRDELLSRTIFDIRPPSERGRLEQKSESDQIDPERPVLRPMGVWLYQKKDGTLAEYEIQATNVSAGGRPARFIVAQNMAGHSALRESESRYRALALRLQTVREEERVELSRTIHDELGQALTALKIDLSMISKRLDPSLQERTEASAAAVDRLIQQVRNIATGLRPAVLDHLGLVAALEWQANEFTRRTGLPCQFQPPAEEPVLTQDQAVSLFRIVQESLTNVARHAQASHVIVSLLAGSNAIRLTVEDDGIGLPQERRNKHTSLGLIGMEERARFVDARLSVQRRAGRGTVIIVDLPVHKKPPEKALL